MPSTKNRGIEFTLPFPPSVNNWLRIMRGRAVKSKEYRAWQEGAGMVVSTLYAGELVNTPGVEVTIWLDPPNRRRFDIDNRVKPILDAMEGYIYTNDYYVDKLTVYRGRLVTGGQARVFVEW